MSRFARRRSSVRKLHLTALEDRLTPTTQFVWNGNAGDTLWSNPGNWQGNVAPTGSGSEDLNFPSGVAVAHTTAKNDLGPGKPFDAITVDGSGYILDGNMIKSNNFYLTVTCNASDATILLSIGSSVNFNLTGTGTLLHVKGSLTSGSVLKSGPGVLELLGSNFYLGTTQVYDGTLKLKTGATPNTSVPGPLVIGDGSGGFDSAVVQLESNDVINDLSAVTINGDGFLDMNGWLDHIGSVDGTGNLTLTGATSFLWTGANGMSTNLSGDLEGSGSLSKQGGGVFKLSGFNTFDGYLNVESGTVQLGTSYDLTQNCVATVSAGATLDLLGSSQLIAALWGSGAVVLGTGGQLTAGNGNNFEFDGVISGAGTFRKQGAGTLTLGGANNFTGKLSVDAGTVRYGANNVIAATCPVSVAGTLDMNGHAGLIGPLTVAGGTVSMSGGVLEPAGLTMTGGQINAASGYFDLNGDVTVNAASGSATIAGNLSLTGATRTFTVARGSGSDDLVIDGVIVDGGASSGVIKAGPGFLRYTGTGANTYTGTTTVNAGTLTLNKSANDTAIVGPLVVFGTLVTTADNLIADTAPVTINGGVWQDNRDETVGPLTMTAGSINVNSGKTLTLAGDVTVTASPNTSTITGNLDLGGATRKFSVADGSQVDDLIIDGAIYDGGLTKDGAGTLTMRGLNNTYTGTTTVTSGVLTLSKLPGGLGIDGPLVVGAQATVETRSNNYQISRTVPITINPSGALWVGGSETVGSLTMHSDAALIVDSGQVLTLSDGFTADVSVAPLRLYAAGEFDLSGSPLTVDFGTPPNVNESRKIIDNQGVNNVVGNFAGLSEGDQFTSGGKAYQITYQGGDGNDIVATRLPAAIVVSAPTRLVTTEAGGTATFTVTLGSIPASDVTITLSSNNSAEGTIDKTSLTFTQADALTPQTVTVTGVADAVADGNVVYSIITGAAASSDTDYNGLDPRDVLAVNLDPLPKGTRTYKDTDGDIYTVRLTGPGTVEALIADPTGNGPGPIDRIMVQGTDPTKSSLSIAVKKGPNGDGLVSVGSITGSGLKNIAVRASDLVGSGVDLVGPLGSLAVHDVLPGTSVIAAGTPDQKTRIRAHVIGKFGSQRVNILLGSAISNLTAAEVETCLIVAPSIGSLAVTGDMTHGIGADFIECGVYLSGAGVLPGKNTLGSVRIAMEVFESTFAIAAGNVGAFRAGAFDFSNLFVGFTPTNRNDPMSGGTFAPGSTIGSFRVTGFKGITIPAFADSILAADNIGTVSLQSVQTTNNGTKFGVLAHTQIGAVNAGAPSLHYKKGQSLPAPIDDFEVKIN
jgi:autotransporter-associated beta strand protein